MQSRNDSSKVARFWDRESADWGQKYEKRTSYFYRCETFRGYFAATGLKKARILDYGCGSGDVSFPLLKDGHTVTGVDIAAGMVRKATERARESGYSETTTYRLLDDAALASLKTQKFDVVICSSVLEYVDDDTAVIRMFSNVLDEGGFLLVSVPDRKSLFCYLDRWLYANRSWLPRSIPVHKLAYLDIQKRQYDVDSFVRLVESIGFKLLALKHNTITLQRGALMEKVSNVPGMGMLALMMFERSVA